MAKNYAQHVSRKATPQSEAIPGREADMVENNAGGFSFAVDDWSRLRRFLVLGSEGGSYYANERKLTQENAAVVGRCADADFERTLNEVVTCSVENRAPKNDQAIFALALLASRSNPDQNGQALARLPEVCRIGTHLFQFVENLKHLRGFGRQVNRALADWYLRRTPLQTAQQVTKYAGRNGWTHADILRKAKPKGGNNPNYDGLFAYITGKPWQEKVQDEAVRGYLDAVTEAKQTDSPKRLASLIEQYHLPWEVLPTEQLKHPEVWEALLPHMGITACLRNLGRMSAIGLLKPLSQASRTVVAKFADFAEIKQQRLHPFNILVGLTTYQAGRGVKGSLNWVPDSNVAEAVEQAYHAAFDAVVPTGQRYLLALDVSGSMSTRIANTHISCRMGAAAMALVTRHVEPWCHTVYFSSDPAREHWGNRGVAPVEMDRKTSLTEIDRMLASLPWGGTDCAAPMIYATAQKLEVDTFVVYTDSETWAGSIHPSQALKQYRQQSGINARLVVVGMVSNGFTIADPADAGMLDVVGFDTSTPQVISEFSAGNI